MSQILYKLKLLFGRREITVLDGSSVSAIAGMQRQIDAYEDYIFALHTLLKRKNSKVSCLLHYVPLAELMNDIWREISDLVEQDKKKDNE